MKFKLAIIGGGPAGMMAAVATAEKLKAQGGNSENKIILIEKNKRLGSKLLITGKGRCNLTNYLLDLHKFIAQFGKNGRFLYSTLNRFGVEETLEFFQKHGLKLKIERGKRVFPKSDRSKDVLNLFIKLLKENRISLRLNSEITEIKTKNNRITEIIDKNSHSIKAENFIIATGGKSYPQTGSDGKMFDLIFKLGHKITELKPALTPLILEEDYLKELEGLSLKNVRIDLFKNNKKINFKFGEALFTKNGMSGPIVLDLSVFLEDLEKNNYELKIDFKPALDFKKLDQRVQRDFQLNQNKSFKNSLDKLLPKKLIPIIIDLSKIDPNQSVNSINKQQRKNLVRLLKEFKLKIKALAGFKKSIVTKGGVNLKEIDPKTMRSKIIENLYFAGEVLDLNGPSGGFNLQACFSTGYVAGNPPGTKVLGS